MKHLLLVAYYFPPIGGAGSQRPMSFSRYLPEHGWRVTVVTRSMQGEGGKFDPRDASLDALESADVSIVRIEDSIGEGPAWAQPKLDRLQGWLAGAKDSCLDIVAKDPVDCVMITMSPFSLAHLGARLREECDVPLVYDLRDPWALDGWPKHAHRGEWNRHVKMMRRALDDADLVIANTQDAKLAIAARFENLHSDRMAVVTNGYSASDFAGDVPERDPESFLFVFTGTLLCGAMEKPAGMLARCKEVVSYRAEPLDVSGRTPKHLLRAIELLRDDGHPLGERIEVVLVGQADDALRRCVEASSVADAVEIKGYLRHEESIAWLRRADALFLPLHGLPTGRRSLIVPGKTYEYLASGTPILGCLPAGDAYDLVARTKNGVLAEPCEAGSIASALRTLWERYEGGKVDRSPEEWVGEYERGVIASRVAELLNDLVRRSRTGSA